MTETEAKKLGLELIKNSQTVILSSIGPGGYPNTKAMLAMDNDGLKTVWFTTNTSSKRVAQFKKDPRACVYYFNPAEFKGLMLVGDIEVLQDKASRERIWRPGFEMYYPQGVMDPDYSVLKFTAKNGNFYANLSNVSFKID